MYKTTLLEKSGQLKGIREKAAKLLYPPIYHLHFTDHSISHSDRIIEKIQEILKGQPFIDLKDKECFILCAAAYLHDIGMQIPKSKLLAYPDLNTLLDKSNLRRQDLDNQEHLASFVREWHHLFSEYMILNSLIWNDLDLGLGDLHPGDVAKIALVAKGHRKVDLFDSEFSPVGGIRLRLLTALLKLADALDCDKKRVDLAKLGILDLDLNSKLHWFFHYCVEQVNIKDYYLEIHALVPPGHADIFKALFITPLWQEYFQVLDIIKSHRIVLAWAPSRVIEHKIMDLVFQNFDSSGVLKEYIAQRRRNIWENTGIYATISVLGKEKLERSELELSPYYFTGLEEFRGIQLKWWPEGAYGCSYSIFDNPRILAKPIWRSPIIKKGNQEDVNLPPPDFQLEEEKRYAFRIDFYHKADLIFLSQRGVFWVIEKRLAKMRKEMLESISGLSAEERKLCLGIIAESIKAYEEAIKVYSELVDMIAEDKIEVICRLVIILEKLFQELDNLRWGNERDQIRRNLAYWARLSLGRLREDVPLSDA